MKNKYTDILDQLVNKSANFRLAYHKYLAIQDSTQIRKDVKDKFRKRTDKASKELEETIQMVSNFMEDFALEEKDEQ